MAAEPDEDSDSSSPTNYSGLRCSSEGSEFCGNEEVRSSYSEDGSDEFVVEEPPSPLAVGEDPCADVEGTDVYDGMEVDSEHNDPDEAEEGHHQDGGMDLDSECDGVGVEDNFYERWEERAIDSIADVGSLNLNSLSLEEIKLLHFPDLSVAFSFYNLYAKMNGFAARRSRMRRNVKGECTQQSFVCFRQGFREVRAYEDRGGRKREPKPQTRCGCRAEMRVYIHVDTGRWMITYFNEVHNHELLLDELTFMLSGHRKMNDAAIDQMNTMLRVGIRTPQIYASFVNTSGGFENVPFSKRDMYNQIHKQRKLLGVMQWHV